VHGYHGDEEDALADRLFAQHLIMERPELQRYGLNDYIYLCIYVSVYESRMGW
jgi:hypothetical protein